MPVETGVFIRGANFGLGTHFFISFLDLPQ